MKGGISRNFIDNLIARVDIVDLVSSRLALKRAGRDFSACCPFHNEKTPSFTVSPEKQFYYCFGCGATGNVIGFLMEYDRLPFVEAIETLARFAGVEVVREDGGDSSRERQHHQQLRRLLSEVAEWFRHQLLNQPAGSRCRNYVERRGLDQDAIDSYSIGYAPAGWDLLLSTFSHYGEALLLESGVVKRGEDGRIFDRFRDRLIFPIRTPRGETVAFGGRVLGDERPKYLNSPESPLFHKGGELYGLHEALKADRRPERLLIVEGYMDVVALYQFGVYNAVATLGTSTTAAQLERGFRSCSELVFCFDGDAAGKKAAWRALEQALPVVSGERSIRFLFLPAGEDPDSLIREEGRERFANRIDQALPLTTYLIDELSSRSDLATVEGPARMLARARSLVGRVVDGPFRENLLLRLSERLQMESGRVARLLGDATPPTAVKPARQQATPTGQQDELRTRRPARSARFALRESSPTYAEQALARLLHSPELAVRAGEPNRFLELEMAGTDELVELLRLLQAEPGLVMAQLVERMRGYPLVELAAQRALKLLLSDAEAIGCEFDVAIQGLDRLRIEQRRSRLWQLVVAGHQQQEDLDELRELDRQLREFALKSKK